MTVAIQRMPTSYGPPARMITPVNPVLPREPWISPHGHAIPSHRTPSRLRWSHPDRSVLVSSFAIPANGADSSEATPLSRCQHTRHSPGDVRFYPTRWGDPPRACGRATCNPGAEAGQTPGCTGGWWPPYSVASSALYGVQKGRHHPLRPVTIT